jgi:hypothetical protein
LTGNGCGQKQNSEITGASLDIKVMGSYKPAAGTSFIIFTSPNDPVAFTNPTLIKANGHHFIIFNEQDNGSWNVVLTAVAQLFKMELKQAGGGLIVIICTLLNRTKARRTSIICLAF